MAAETPGIRPTGRGRPLEWSPRRVSYPWRKEASHMEKRTLCPACETCPEIVAVGESVRIGEIVVTKATWNGLVDAIKAGRLGRA